MRIYFFALVIISTITFALDAYIYFQIREKLKLKLLKVIYWLPTLLFLLGFVSMYFGAKHIDSKTITELQYFVWIFWALIIYYIPKLNIIIIDSIRLLIKLIWKKNFAWIKYTAYSLALLSVSLILYGTFVTRFDFHVNNVEVVNNELPKAFDGFKIAQVSDIHLGGWGKQNYAAMDSMCAIIMRQKPDMIVFTGDMVNNFHEETEGWKEHFKLSAPYGVYAILGNHDYGDYSIWKKPEEKTKNLNKIKDAIRSFGFTLLLDSSVVIKKETDSIGLIGMENWGHPPFPQYGNFQKAKSNTNNLAYNVLLSHDPTHFHAEVKGLSNVQLTLSGHIHGLQFGYIGKNFKISPAKFILKEWCGLHQFNKQHLYVNVGIGYVGYPTRIGIKPEITCLTLRTK